MINLGEGGPANLLQSQDWVAGLASEFCLCVLTEIEFSAIFDIDHVTSRDLQNTACEM